MCSEYDAYPILSDISKGVIFDPLLTFAGHARQTAAKASRRNSILIAVAGSTWGHNKLLRFCCLDREHRPAIVFWGNWA